MTVRALARELGVSATTVSLALKNNPRVSLELRQQIQKRASEAGYVPNARLSELMNEVRRSTTQTYRATLAAFSLYPLKEPWRERPYLKVVLDSAMETARSHGYKMEYFWLKQPGLTPARFRAILETRNIVGLFCLGSLDPEEEMPADLRKFAIVTFAASIPTKLHRVMSHFTSDAHTLFDELLRRGYQRPGLAILIHGDRRTDYAYSSAYLSAWERQLRPPNVPILRSDEWDEEGFDRWFRAQRPDVIVLHQHAAYIAGVEAYLKRHNLRVPRDVGLALLDMNPNLQRYSGIRQDPVQMGRTAAEMLIGRVLLRDLEMPRQPKVELVEGNWNEGRTLRPRAKHPVLGVR
jgi:LacI family transcriptional regulator